MSAKQKSFSISIFWHSGGGTTKAGECTRVESRVGWQTTPGADLLDHQFRHSRWVVPTLIARDIRIGLRS